MSDMKKINEGYDRNYIIGSSDIYRKFGDQFDKLFDAKEVAKDKKEFEKMYVHDKNFEKQLWNFRKFPNSITKFCVGYTGIGKSTTLRHVFELGVSKEAFFNTKKKEIVFLTCLDGYQRNEIKKFNLVDRIAAVCRGMENLYPELREILPTIDGKKEFYKFVQTHTSYILQNINPFEAMDMDENEEILSRLKGAYEKYPFEYFANLLKFYIKKKYDLFHQLIIILDDIESLPENSQKSTIAEFLKLQDCMQNTDYPQNGKYNVKLLITIRPHTYRLMRTDREIESFAISDPPIIKYDSVDLTQLFSKRFNYYTESSDKVIGNKDTWEKCYAELEQMNELFDGKYKTMIKNLCFKNVREALASYARVFANRFWVQKNKPREDIFTISAPEYSFNNINVIRSLACNEEKMFWGDIGCIIPNIFDTTKEKDYSIYCLLVLYYFKNKGGQESYGKNSDSLNEVLDNWSNVFGQDITDKMKQSMNFLFLRKILRKAIDDSDDEKTLDTLESLTPNSKLYISPRGYEMCKMLMGDSVLLEMLRENAWRDYEDWEYSEECSSDLMSYGRQDLIFVDLLEYIEYLAEKEMDIVVIIKTSGNMQAYKDIYGQTPIMSFLLEGVKKSLDYSGYIYEESVREKYNAVKKTISRISVKI